MVIPRNTSTIGRILSNMNASTVSLPKFKFSLYSTGALPTMNVSMLATSEEIETDTLNALINPPNGTARAALTKPIGLP